MRRLLLTTLFVVPSFLNGQITIAAEEAANSSVVTYDKEYFEKFDAVTLLDMLNRIPGVQEILNKSRRERDSQANFGAGASERGFGAGGDQILINGKRLAGKDINIDDTLARVTASQVVKIDLIRGAAEGLDVQSEGLVINITLDQSATQSTTFWRIGGRAYLGQKQAHLLTLSHSGSTGKLDYTVTAESERKYRYSLRDEQYLYGGSDIVARQIDSFTPNRKDNHKLSSNISYNFEDGAVLRLNGLYNPETQYDFDTRLITYLDESFGPAISVVDDTLTADGNRKLSEVWSNRVTPTKWEIGGDYSRSLGVLGSLKSLFVFNKENRD
ncbi:MAG: TonB-dependent receptor plug domain-containing protein, partial [Kordiimonadaceae bacterium]|nr:TonB-dependent receptor plug domain-containing protein [Kordiimonadaceae bacterium]